MLAKSLTKYALIYIPKTFSNFLFSCGDRLEDRGSIKLPSPILISWSTPLIGSTTNHD